MITHFSSHIMIKVVISLIPSQIEPYQGNGDDTAVNAIRLLCKQALDGFPEVSSVTSATMRWGKLQPKLYCPDDYWIVAFRVSNMIHDCLRMLIFAINRFCLQECEYHFYVYKCVKFVFFLNC